MIETRVQKDQRIEDYLAEWLPKAQENLDQGFGLLALAIPDLLEKHRVTESDVRDRGLTKDMRRRLRARGVKTAILTNRYRLS